MYSQSQKPFFPREGDDLCPDTPDDALAQPDIAAAVAKIEAENIERLQYEGVSPREFERQATATGDDYPELFSVTRMIGLK